MQDLGLKVSGGKGDWRVEVPFFKGRELLPGASPHWNSERSLVEAESRSKPETIRLEVRVPSKFDSSSEDTILLSEIPFCGS